MIDTKYTYAVARIRALETALFTSATLDQLMACQTEEQCLQLIQEKGWRGYAGECRGNIDQGAGENLGEYQGSGC